MNCHRPGGESVFIYFYFFTALFFFALNFNFVAGNLSLINFVVVHFLLCILSLSMVSSLELARIAKA